MQILKGVEGKLGRGPARLLTSGGDGRRDVFHVTFDPAEEDVTEAVVRAVAVIHNVEPADLPPLVDVVDPDALSALFGPAAEAFDSDVQATFVYQDLEITVDSDGNLWLEWV